MRAQLQPDLHSEVRTTVSGHVQRGRAPTAFDRALATQYGNPAAALVREGRFGERVRLCGGGYASVSLSHAAGRNRCVPAGRSVLMCARQIGVSLGDGA